MQWHPGRAARSVLSSWGQRGPGEEHWACRWWSPSSHLPRERKGHLAGISVAFLVIILTLHRIEWIRNGSTSTLLKLQGPTCPRYGQKLITLVRQHKTLCLWREPLTLIQIDIKWLLPNLSNRFAQHLPNMLNYTNIYSIYPWPVILIHTHAWRNRYPWKYTQETTQTPAYM